MRNSIGAFIIIIAASSCTTADLANVGGRQLAVSMPLVRISEFHYDNGGADVGEAIEISGPAGMDVTGWKIVPYNGSGGVTYAITGMTLSGTIPATCGSRGVIVLPAVGLQNGAPDGMALVDAANTVIEFLSYEGPFLATNGPAIGLTSTDVGVLEIGTEPAGTSLQRHADGTWVGPIANTFGACNDNDGTPLPDLATPLPDLATPVIVTVTVSPATASVVLGATKQFSAAAFDSGGLPITGVTFSWTSSPPEVASVDANGLATSLAAGDATITATAPNGIFGSAALHVDVPAGLPEVRFGELHYDNSGTDSNEAIEIEGPVGFDLTNWSVILYDGSPTGTLSPYNTQALSGTIPATCDTRGVVVINYPTNGLQNGSPDGMALVDNNGQVVEFLSYEGSFTAATGPAAGLTATDIIVSEASNAPVGTSLQRDPTGAWHASAPATLGLCWGQEPPPPANTITFSGRVPSDPALPVGFQDQVFATVRDGNGAAVSTTITWTSETPSIATIDQNGVITALAAGTLTVRATGGEGTTAAYSLPTRVAVASTTAVYAGNTEFGIPQDADPSDDFVVVYDEYTASYNQNRGTSNWVSYDLEQSHFGSEDRCDCFTFDPALPASFTHYTTADYTGAGAIAGYGIDRGHMTRSFDRTTGSLDNAFTFYFSNVVPQASDLNQGPWAIMENYLGDQARFQNKEVYIIAGVAGSKGTLKNEGKVVIPAKTWKVAVIMDKDHGLIDVHDYTDVQVIAVIMPNDPGVRNVDWHTYETTVDAVEALSGYDLLSALPDEIENAVEAAIKPPIAAVSAPVATSEGGTVAFSGAGSHDPNGTVVSYAWNFGDNTTGAGQAVTHTYTQDGHYTVTLTVTDNDGLTATITTAADVSNVAPTVSPFNGATLRPGELYTASGSFTDPGADVWSGTVDYGDGTGAVALALDGMSFSLSHSYVASGTFVVTVRISDDDATSTATQTVTVLTRPVAAVGGPFATNEGGTVAFSGAGSSDPDGTVVSYAWDFGDSSSGAGQAVTHTYVQDGHYTVTLTVTDNDGLTGSITTTVEVSNVAPVVGAFAGTTLLTGEVYSASGSFSDPGADVWSGTVDYDDGSGAVALPLNGMSFSLSHTYLAAGTYLVTVRISDDDATSMATQTVTVLARPVAAVGGPFAINEGGTVAFSGAGSFDLDGTVVSYAWDFGDGTPNGAGQAVTHTYAQDGHYTVTLTVTDNDGLSGSITTTADISNVAPAVGAFAGATLLPHEVYSASGSFTDPGADAWSATVNYGDGTGTVALALSGMSFSLSHTYLLAGTFVVTVRVSDDDATSTATQTVTVLTPKQAIQNAMAMIDALVAAGKLTNSTGNSLKSKLANAIKSLDKGNVTDATIQLQSTLSQLDALVRNGTLSAADADPIRALLNRVITSL